MSAMTIEAASASTAMAPTDSPMPDNLQQTGSAARRFVRSALRIMAKALMEYRIRQATRELARLDDRLLKDIGLSRWALEDAVRSNRAAGMNPLGPEWAWLTGCGGDCDGCPGDTAAKR